MRNTRVMSNYSDQSTHWKQARRAALVQDVLTGFTHRPADLRPFEEVRHKLHLDQADELGLQEVPLDHIAGSVGRYQDFTRAFFPRRDDLQARWQRIDQLLASGGCLPPIDLYKVGQVYFVRDGNHRVSVARQRKLPTIQAYVWEFKTSFPLQPDSDIDALLCQAARAAFLERADLDRLCPSPRLELTQPDGYAELLAEIESYQQFLSDLDRRQVPFDEAVMLWHELRYTPVVEIIQERDALREFPGRTEADLYLWLCRNQEELQAAYGQQVLMEEAAADLGQRFGKSFSPPRFARKAARWVVATGVNWVSGWRRAARRVFSRR